MKIVTVKILSKAVLLGGGGGRSTVLFFWGFLNPPENFVPSSSEKNLFGPSGGVRGISAGKFENGISLIG